MAAQAGLFLILFFLAKATDPEHPARWIVWNVGQGQWVTRVESGDCRHFDMGGERAPWSEVMALCRARKNYVLLSHWDLDHISFSGRARYFLPNLCRERLPGGEPSEKKRRMVERISACDKNSLRKSEKLYSVWRPALERKVTTNENSAVVKWGPMLIPGDSTKSMEKIWAYEFHDLDKVKFLIAGHHGSHTSTGEKLMKRLPNLKLAIASSRKRRYGHPHRKTVEVFRKFRTPILTTEDWGNLHIWQ